MGELTVAAYGTLDMELGEYAATLLDVDGRAASADVLVAESAGRIVGAVTYVPGPQSSSAEFDDPSAAGLRFLAVAPEAQGRGVGRALLRHCVERAREAGRARLLLHTTAHMHAARVLYEREGFLRAPSLDLRAASGVWLLAYRCELL